MRQDPNGHGILQVDNGVTAYAFNTGRGLVVEAVCAHWSEHGRSTTGAEAAEVQSQRLTNAHPRLGRRGSDRGPDRHRRCAGKVFPKEGVFMYWRLS